MSHFPISRPRRLRAGENLRRLVRETAISTDDLIYPMFVVHGHMMWLLKSHQCRGVTNTRWIGW